jgi:hypothetical protein
MVSITRLSGGLTPANGADPRTFPAIWNTTADTIEGLDLNDLADVTITSATTGQIVEWNGTAWVNGQVDAAGIASDAVTTAKILNANVTADKLASNSVTTAKIANANVTSAKLGPGTILQVVSATKTDRFSSSSTTFVDVTSLTATITPRATSSKIFVFGAVPVSVNDSDQSVALILVRGSTEIGSGTPGGSRLGAITVGNSASANQSRTANGQQGTPFAFLDSPNTTSATTYKIQARVTTDGAFAINGNQSNSDSNLAENSRTQSTITLMEVAG